MAPSSCETRCFRGCCASSSVRLDIPMTSIEASSEVLARGAASKVKRGRFEGLEVAVKYPSLPTSDDLDRFHKELGIHLEFTGEGREFDHVVPLVAARAHPPHYVTLTPLATGNLQQHVHDTEEGRRRGLGYLGLCLQIARGVAALHAKGYVHRDLKPANVLITSSGCAQLTDFQLTEKECDLVSLFASSDVRLSNAGKKPTGGFHKKLLVGTLEYMAPEILTKTSHTRKSDVYSLSILLNECVTGTFPFSDCHKERPGCHTVLELGYGHQELKAAVVCEGLRPTTLDPGALAGEGGGAEEAARALNALLERCWSLDPNLRPDIGEVCDALESILAGYDAPAVAGAARPADAEVASRAAEKEGRAEAMAVDPSLVIDAGSAEGAALAQAGVFRGKALELKCGYFQTIGSRDSQEDRVVQSSPYPYAGGGGAHLLAVIDGHRGGEASEHCERRLCKVLADCLRAEAAEAPPSTTAAEPGLDLPSRALVRCFRSLDASFQNANPGCNAGATALACLVCGSRVYVANCGDCRCVVGGAFGARDLSRDHTTSCARERARIEAAEGGRGALSFQVDSWRIGRCGLQVTRSIGDADVKPLGVTSDPEITVHDLGDGDDFLCLASDGLWDVVSSDEVAGMVRDTVKNPSMVAQRLGLEAASRGSGDNISVLVAFTKQGVGSHERIFANGREEHAFTQTYYGSR